MTSIEIDLRNCTLNFTTKNPSGYTKLFLLLFFGLNLMLTHQLNVRCCVFSFIYAVVVGFGLLFTCSGFSRHYSSGRERQRRPVLHNRLKVRPGANNSRASRTQSRLEIFFHFPLHFSFLFFKVLIISLYHTLNLSRASFGSSAIT